MKDMSRFFKGVPARSEEEQNQINTLITRLNGAALTLWGVSRAETAEERERLAFSGVEFLRSVRNQLSELGMDYQA